MQTITGSDTNIGVFIGSVIPVGEGSPQQAGGNTQVTTDDGGLFITGFNDFYGVLIGTTFITAQEIIPGPIAHGPAAPPSFLTPPLLFGNTEVSTIDGPLVIGGEGSLVGVAIGTDFATEVDGPGRTPLDHTAVSSVAGGMSIMVR